MPTDTKQNVTQKANTPVRLPRNIVGQNKGGAK